MITKKLTVLLLMTAGLVKAQVGTQEFTRIATKYHYSNFDKLSLKYLDADSNEVVFASEFPNKSKASLYWDNDAKDGKLYVNFFLNNEIADHDNTKNYYFQLENRQSIRTHSNKWVTGVGSVPVRYRPAQSGSAGIVEPKVELDYNLSTFLGYSFSGEKFTHYNNLGIKKKQSYNVIVSGLIGVSSTEVDERASFLSVEPVSNTFSAPVFNFGGSLQTCFNNFVIGGAMGFDFMIGDYADSWHYNGRPWYGLMFGYRYDIFSDKNSSESK